MAAGSRMAVMATVLAFAGAACSGAPSDDELRAAADRLLAAPTPDGFVPSSDAPHPAESFDGRGVFRQESCSDGSCPALLRWFDPVGFVTVDDACAAFAAWVDQLGGGAMEPCPPETVQRIAAGGSVSTGVRVLLPEGAAGNLAFAELVASDEGSATMALALAWQFCSDSAVGWPCED